MRGIAQKAKPPMLANAIIEFEWRHRIVEFQRQCDARARRQNLYRRHKRLLVSVGPSLSEQSVTLYTDEGFAKPELKARGFYKAFTAQWRSCFARLKRIANL